jgi:hypothetical protein
MSLAPHLLRRSRLPQSVLQSWCATPDTSQVMDLHVLQHEGPLERLGRRVPAVVDATTWFLDQSRRRADQRHLQAQSRVATVVCRAGGSIVSREVPNAVIRARMTPRQLVAVLRDLGPDLDRISPA